MYSNRIVMRLSASDWLMQSVALTTIAKKRSINTEAPRHHLRLRPQRPEPGAPARTTSSIPYMALDLDPDRVRQAAAAGQSVVFGDAARLQSLMAAGLARASAVVVSYHDTPSALKILRLVQAHAPKVPVIVRTIDDSDLERLRAAGATEVVPEAIEGSLMLASHALALVGVPMRRVHPRRAASARRALRPAARLLPRRRRRHRRRAAAGAPADSVTLPAPAACGRAARSAAPGAAAVGVTVVSVRRASGAVPAAGRRDWCSAPATRWCCRACPSRWR